MKYFDNLNETTYELNEGEIKTIKNLFNKLFLQNFDYSDEEDFLEPYIISEGETPEEVSYKYYGTTDYWWIILIVNQVKDVFYDWPMSNSELREYSEEMLKLYPDDPQYEIENLIEENDNKRFINLLKEEYFNELISNYLTKKSMGDVVVI